LYAERDALRTKAVAVEQAITTLEQRINAHDSVLSPVRRTPVEILCEIFHWTLPHDRRVHGSRRNIPTAPWQLTHVCRHWRGVAHGDPNLW
ncbi:hypothetical protein K438DRAFT_1482977, partial [Mycena galopus ATCC 62051]